MMLLLSIQDLLMPTSILQKEHKEFKYTKGATVVPKLLDPKRNGDVSGIYFVLSRAEAEAIQDKKEEDED